MKFKFNFNSDSDDSHSMTCHDKENVSIKSFRECCKHIPCFTTNQNLVNVDDNFNNICLDDDFELFYLKPDIATQQIKSNANEISCFLQSSDLASGEYEGGLKVWECTIDLLHYMHNNKELFKNRTVLDLGCGAGMLGAYAFLLDADKVVLQDYNSEVIEYFTIPSIQKTVKHSTENFSLTSKFDFLSGDWSNVKNYFVNNNSKKFDLILSSETIYNISYYGKIKEVLSELLSDDGIALFAAKKHYFGVGGGIYDFTKYLEDVGSFETNIVKTINDSLTREILQVKKRKDD